MSSDQVDERKEYVQREPAPQNVAPTIVQERVVPSQSVPLAAPATTVAYPQTPPVEERKDTVVRRRSTNTGAIVAMVFGILILLFGLYLVFTRVLPFLPYPWSMIAILIVGVILIAVGASLVANRGATTATTAEI